MTTTMTKVAETSLLKKRNSRYSIPCRSVCQTLVNFSGVEFSRTVS